LNTSSRRVGTCGCSSSTTASGGIATASLIESERRQRVDVVGQRMLSGDHRE
jgi:hypothetical protein